MTKGELVHVRHAQQAWELAERYASLENFKAMAFWVSVYNDKLRDAKACRDDNAGFMSSGVQLLGNRAATRRPDDQNGVKTWTAGYSKQSG
jgi:hypothetical protein